MRELEGRDRGKGKGILGGKGWKGDGERGGKTDRKICFWPEGGRKVFGGRGPSLRVRGGMLEEKWGVEWRDSMEVR